MASQTEVNYNSRNWQCPNHWSSIKFGTDPVWQMETHIVHIHFSR